MPRLERTDAMLLMTLVVVTFLAYARSFGGDWISDDVTAIVENPIVRSLTPANLKLIATTFGDGVNYIPLNFLSFAIDHQLWGYWPPGFHLTNVLVHLANGVAIYYLLLRLGETAGIAAAATLLWSLHPVQVESVAWISERKNVLSTLFFLLAFHAYLRFSATARVRPLLLLVIFYVAALVTKVNTIVLPALTITYELVVHRRCRPRDLGMVAALLACGAFVGWFNLHGSPYHGVEYHGGSLAVTMRTSSTVFPRYLQSIIAPFDLSSYYPIPLRASWLDPPVAGSVAAMVALTMLTLWLGWWGRIEAFWLVWFAATLSPMLNLVPFPSLINDRYLYVPLLGALVPLVRLVHSLLVRVHARALAPALTVLVVLAVGVLTFQRVPVFHDELSLWADFGLRTSYITADRPYGARPRPDRLRLLNEALAAHPERAALHNNLAAFAYEENRAGDAVSSFERARTLDPSDPVIALNLGRTYLAVGRIDDAVRTLEEAVALEPPSFYPHLNLARAYLRRGDVTRARASLTTAKTIRHDPGFWGDVERQVAQAERQNG